MSLDHAILGFLAERERSGYDLKTRCFEGAASAFWSADQAQIYRTLERLSRGKAVKSRTRRQSGRPDRRLYEITPIGRQQLDAWVECPHPLPPTRDPLLLQLGFSGDLDDPELREVLAAARLEHQSKLDALRVHATNQSSDTSLGERTTAVRLLALNGAMATQRAAIDWLDDSIELLEDTSSGGARRKGRRIGRR
ncbi:MAG: PadR family transcriptional regulator [Coriobacteriales bacterium]|nr:PadR family transcriptional regulator [Coriobacteriales bacterium]